MIASAKLTENKTQFFGITTIEYRDQMAPVAVSDTDWFNESLSAGLNNNLLIWFGAGIHRLKPIGPGLGNIEK